MYEFQVASQNNEGHDSKTKHPNIDSTTSSASLESPTHRNSQETFSPNNYSSCTVSSTDNSINDFTQVENNHINGIPPVPNLVFNAKITIYEKPSYNSFTRSLSLDPKFGETKIAKSGKYAYLHTLRC